MKITAIVIIGSDTYSYKMLAGCLKTLEFCDETLLVDFSGGKHKLPNGKKISIVKVEPDSSFAKIRHKGAKEAKGDWLFYVDPDERVSSELRSETVLSIKNKVSSGRKEKVLGMKNVVYSNKDKKPNTSYSIPHTLYSGYYLSRRNFYLGKEFKHAGAWPDKVLRLIKKDSLKGWQGDLHEQPVIEGKTGELKSPIIHLTHRSIRQMTEKTLNWSKKEAKLRLDSKHPMMTSWRFWRIIFSSFWENFVKKGAWKDGTEGTIEGIFQMFSMFMTYVRLWEAQQKPSLEEKYRKIEMNIDNIQ